MASFLSSSFRLPSRLFFQRRCYWQEIVRCVPHPQTGNPQYEDPQQSALRAVRGMGNDDAKRERKRVTRYEKPWMKRQRLKQARIYGRKKQQVIELTKYVRFMQDYKQTQDK